LRTIAPSGHLHTFDFHQQRVDIATEEFKDHKLSNFVTARQRDVCKEGFDLENVADAVFLDLPHPWDAVSHAKKALKKATGGRICSFSPCVEQVQKTIAKMREEGFSEISTVECLIREFQVRKITIPTYDHLKQSIEFTEDWRADSSKKRKLQTKVEEEEEEEEAGGGEKATCKNTSESSSKKQELDASFVTGLPCTSMPGHTGYLTFATLNPDLK
jgi:tRNA (adenine57-N1/adenine58-N1)-methyltransferase